MLVAVFAVLAGVALETWYGHKADDAADNIRARLELDALNMSSRDVRDFATFLKDKPKGEVRVLYKHEDFEAYWFALEICIGLRELGWKVDGEPQSIPSTGGDPAFANKDVPSEVKYDAQTGLAIWGKNTNAWNEGTARSALKNALTLGVDRGGATILPSDSSLPENHFLIVVGENFPVFQR
jgi:hypothetical protein